MTLAGGYRLSHRYGMPIGNSVVFWSIFATSCVALTEKLSVCQWTVLQYNKNVSLNDNAKQKTRRLVWNSRHYLSCTALSNQLNRVAEHSTSHQLVKVELQYRLCAAQCDPVYGSIIYTLASRYRLNVSAFAATIGLFIRRTWCSENRRRLVITNQSPAIIWWQSYRSP